MLKQGYRLQNSNSTILPKLDEEGKIILELKEIMEIMSRQMRNLSISEYLIMWKNLPTEHSTWEDDNLIYRSIQSYSSV